MAFMAALTGATAQNCEAILLPKFGNDTARMMQYPEGKRFYFCAYSQASFYESDTVPVGADVFSISAVQNVFTGENLPQNYVVDLYDLSYYAYNFKYFQLQYPHGDKTLCFSTPGSAHPYLVLRSIEEATAIATEQLYEWNQ